MSADVRAMSIAARHHGVLTTAQAVGAGMTMRMIDNRVRSGRWTSPETGLYVISGSADTHERRLWIALLGTSAAAVLSHTTAGAMFELTGHTSVVHVTIPHGDHLRASPGRVVHQARAVERTKVGTFPVTTPRRTLLDLAAVVTPAKLEPMLDEALMRNLVALEPLLRYLDGKTQRGVNVLRRLLVDRRDGVPQEEMEREFKRLVRRFKLPTPKLQHPFGENKRIDAAYPQHKIAIELDSWRHHGSLLAFRADRPRQNVLELDGWMVLRFTWDAIKYRPGEVAETLVTALGRRATTRARPTRASRSRGSG